MDNFIELINNKELLIVYDEKELSDEQVKKLKDKSNLLRGVLINNNIGYAIKAIESCDEIIQNETKKHDGDKYIKPLIVSNYNLEIYKEYYSNVLNANDIMVELLMLKKYGISENNQIIVITNSDISFINNNVIYIPFNDFIDLNIEPININNKKYLEYLNLNKVSLFSIISVYKIIMADQINYTEDVSENNITLKSKNHQLNILYISDINNIDEYNINTYDVVIVDKDKISQIDLLKEEKIIDIYDEIKKPGLYFRREYENI